MSLSFPRVVCLLALSALTSTALARDGYEPVPIPTGSPSFDVPSGYAPADESPDLIISRALRSMEEGLSSETSEAQLYLRRRWKELEQSREPGDFEVLGAHAQYLKRYQADLEVAHQAYGKVLRVLDGYKAQPDASDRLSQKYAEVDEVLARTDMQASLTDATCMIDPDRCMDLDDEDIAALRDEIADIRGRQLHKGATHRASPALLARRAELLRTRAGLKLEEVRLAAIDVEQQIIMHRSGEGFRRLDDPFRAPTGGGSRPTKRTRDPYRD